jgi:hypothetical protein
MKSSDFFCFVLPEVVLCFGSNCCRLLLPLLYSLIPVPQHALPVGAAFLGVDKVQLPPEGLLCGCADTKRCFCICVPGVV